MTTMFLIMAVCCVAGIVQGVTGFGAGIVMMMALPMMYALPQAAGISSAIAIILCAMFVWTYRKYINIKDIAPASVLYLIVCSIAIKYSTVLNQAMMKKVFGVFLVVLCIYYLFFNKKSEKTKMSLPVSAFCIMVSAACDGFFGIGGPLMVLYFLSRTDATEEYLGTIQTFFMINCIYNTGFRFYRGILTISHLPMIAAGMVCIILGGLLAKKLVSHLNADLLKKLTYLMIGISGLINLF